MTAKEMFEELGYEQKLVVDKYNNEIITYEAFWDGRKVEFYTHYKSCYLVCPTSHIKDEVSIPIGGVGGKFILAITQQMKELGWMK